MQTNANKSEHARKTPSDKFNSPQNAKIAKPIVYSKATAFDKTAENSIFGGFLYAIEKNNPNFVAKNIERLRKNAAYV